MSQSSCIIVTTPRSLPLGVPYSTASCCAFLSLFHGVSSEKCISFAIVRKLRQPKSLKIMQPSSFFCGARHPSFNDRFGFGTIKLTSNSQLSPRPLHAGHCPFGSLKLKNLGSSSGIEIPHLGQASCVPCKRYSSFAAPSAPTSCDVSKKDTSFPSVSFKAPSMASRKRLMFLRSSVKRSITTSMVCFS